MSEHRYILEPYKGMNTRYHWQQGRSLRKIGAELGISHMKVSRILKDCNTKEVNNE